MGRCLEYYSGTLNTHIRTLTLHVGLKLHSIGQLYFARATHKWIVQTIGAKDIRTNGHTNGGQDIMQVGVPH